MPTESARRYWRFPLHLIAAAGSTALLLVVVSVLGWAAYRGAQEAMLSVSDETIGRVAVTLEEKGRRILEPAEGQLRLLAYGGFSTAPDLAARLELLPMVSEALEGNSLVDALFAGYANGEFILFRPLRDAAARKRFAAPDTAALMVQSVSLDKSGRMLGEYRFYDAGRRLLRTDPQAEYHFDPRTRPWYRAAVASSGTVLADPYLFFTTQDVGTTLARKTANGAAVIGLDATLEGLATQLDRLRVTPSSELAIVDADSRVLAYQDAARMTVREDGQKLRLARIDELGVPVLTRANTLAHGQTLRGSMEREGRSWQLVSTPLKLPDGKALSILMAIPEDEIFDSARRILHRQVLFALLVLLVSVPLGWWLTQRLILPLRLLAEETKAIGAFDFSPTPTLRSRISEVDRLAVATEQMKGTIASFLDTSVALGSETQLDRLLDTVLRNVLDAVAARSGAIYLTDGPATLVLARRHGDPDANEVPERLSLGEIGNNPAGRAARGRGIATGSGGREIATPLMTRDGTLVGVLVVFLEQGLEAKAGVRDPRLGFVAALSGSAAVAIEARNLIEQQKALLESFIQLLAAAIDAKSPYTGGHCQRVPELAKMLARAAHEAEAGPFRGFRLTENDWESLHIAAWLHDCGKVTTPEYIVDKASKLETLYNRIHEVRMRFEVAKREAEIESLKARLAGAAAEVEIAALQREWDALDADFAFVAECNLGGETMDPQRVERLQRIAARGWTRTLDDRLGLSWEEARQLAANLPATLPVREQLLADKPEHIVARRPEDLLPPDNPWGFRMVVPPNRFNRGELYNLSVARGTLTSEDRYIINEHIVQTIKMLDRLPFPKYLANVPEIAGGHHERMDGKGYPKGLNRGQMSVLARVMAIADVFEALTAADRPYKRPNTLSQSIAIMARMVRDQHLDPDLFALFLLSGVWRSYGERHLSAAQNDGIDVPRMLAEAGISRVKADTDPAPTA